MKNMTTLKWLLKREIWENKVLLIWSNLVLAGVTLLATIPGVFRLYSTTLNLNYPQSFQVNNLTALFSTYLNAEVTVFSILMVFAIYSYATSCLADEKKDRSILFWKSLPISDWLTVLSKLIVSVVFFPIMAISAVTLTTLISMIFFYFISAFYGASVFTFVFVDSGLFGKLWSIFSWFPLYVAWALPAVAWFMLVSAWVKSRAGMWAIFVPVFVSIMVTFTNGIFNLGIDTHHISSIVIYRGLFGIIPNNWVSHFNINPTDQSIAGTALRLASKNDVVPWELLASADLWLGIIAGILMLIAAAKIRRSRGE